ncbi:MAG: hypothetical protein ACREI2_13030 [Nitrospiraceae bacterium]
MPRKPSTTKSVSVSRLTEDGRARPALQSVLWRLARLERQVRWLSQLVRDHAEDADRLVRIVAEDRDTLRQELLRKHEAKLRARKRARAASSKVGLTS